MSRTRALAAGLAAVAAMGGCQDPYGGGRRRPQDSPAVPAGAARGGGPAASRPAPGCGAGQARRAARRFAARWASWDWRSAAGQQRALARLATGALARRLRAGAASARAEAGLARGRLGSRGTAAGVDLAARGARAAGIVVTLEQTYTAGRADLGGRRYGVYLIRLSCTAAGWGVSAWAPQP